MVREIGIGFFGWKDLVAGLILAAAVYTDLKSKKVPNKLILISVGAALVVSLVTEGLSDYSRILPALGTAFVFMLPLYILKAIGGGDVKLIFVLAILSSWYGIINTILGAIVWGSLLGIFQAVLSGQIKNILGNLYLILSRAKPNEAVLHKVPFTVAIFFGWLSNLLLQSAGVKWL